MNKILWIGGINSLLLLQQIARLVQSVTDGTKLMVFGWDSEDLTGPSGNVQGIADLRSNPNVTELYGPVVVTGRTPSENLADQQTAEIKHPKSEIVRGTAHLPISSKKVKTKDVKELHYNGFWFCIPVTELR